MATQTQRLFPPRFTWPTLLFFGLVAGLMAPKSGAESDPQTCTDPVYGKNLLVSPFPRRELSSANIGKLHDVESNLPALLAEALVNKPGIARVQPIEEILASPESAQEPKRAEQARDLAQAHKAHLILSGEVLDMSMANPRDSYKPTLTNRIRNGAISLFRLNPQWDTRQRDFVFRVTLRDGITGEVLARRQYQSQGVWAPDRPHRVGFGSPQFWETGYGQEIADLVKRAGKELEKDIRCQPLMASLDLTAGPDQIVVHSGTDQGLGKGHTLRLHQVITRRVPGEYQTYRIHLRESDTQLKVLESHPSYSIAEIRGELATRHGQYVARALEPSSRPKSKPRVRVFVPPPETNR